jgi:hypothetical protein
MKSVAAAVPLKLSADHSSAGAAMSDEPTGLFSGKEAALVTAQVKGMGWSGRQ